MVMGVDIETYSSVDLAASGVWPYTQAKDFTILLIAYKVDDGPTKLIDLADSGEADPTLFPPASSDIPRGDLEEFLALLNNPTVVKTAYNAAFERTCLAQFFQQPMPPEQWRCTMVLAATVGLPRSLMQAGEVLGLDKLKMAEGEDLIRYFCRPDRDGTRHLPQDAPDKWETFRRYCVRDVDVETEIREKLARWALPPEEQAAWVLDQLINDRGVLLDRTLLEQALALDELYDARLMEEARRLTGLDNPRSDAQLKGWLKERGVVVDTLDKRTLPTLLENAPDLVARRVLELRQELGKTSTRKYDAMRRSQCEDGRVRSLLRFYGAGTGRWSGALVQIHNLPQNKLRDLDLARELVRSGDFDTLELVFGPPPYVLSQLIRTTIIPAEGCRLLVCDYSAIEARVLAWLAGEEWVLQEFRGEGLIYEATAAMMFHVPKEDIRKGGPRAELRAKGKVATLACGYQGGVNALVAMGALGAGIPMEDLSGILRRWREANPNIVRFWAAVEQAAIHAVQGRPTTLAHGLHFQCEDKCLCITLPSGRRLAYREPQLKRGQYGKWEMTYLGTEAHHYTRLQTYGGRLVENISQATARDCLRDAIAALEEAGYRVVMHVHDEIIAEMPLGTGSLEEMRELMGRPLPWAPGLPLRAEGDELTYYRKT